MRAAEQVHLGTARGRWVLAAVVLGSGLAGIDATVVNVALPTIGRDLDTGFATLQWTVTGYALTLASFILLGGVLGDRFGRRRLFVVGIVWFTLASALCGLAPTGGVLVAARVLQGVGGALLTPASLAIIQSGFAPEDRGRAVGAWSGLGGVATAIGPFLGGWLVDAVSWRWVFLINVPVALVVLALARHVPETRDPDASGRVDWAGSLLAAVALAGATYALTLGGQGGQPRALMFAAAVGVVAGAGFWALERRVQDPVLPPSVFGHRQFAAANAVTFTVYGALGVVFFLLVLQLQVVSGFGPVASGTAVLPVTVLMLLLSGRSGQLASRIGPRLQMTLGPLVVAGALALMLRIGAEADYLRDVLPAVALLGLGLAIMVAPLTATALSALPDEHAGLASGVNNAVARTGGLFAVAAVPAIAGLAGDDYTDPGVFDAGFEVAIGICLVGMLASAVLAGLLIRNDVLESGPPAEPPSASRLPSTDHADHSECGETQSLWHCAVGDPPQATGCDRDGHLS